VRGGTQGETYHAEAAGAGAACEGAPVDNSKFWDATTNWLEDWVGVGSLLAKVY